jgi:hypothetical protein
MERSLFIGDFVTSEDFNNLLVPVGIPFKIVGEELEPGSSPGCWNNLSDYIKKSCEPFYALEVPDIQTGEVSIKFAKIDKCKLYEVEDSKDEKQEDPEFWSNEGFFQT